MFNMSAIKTNLAQISEQALRSLANGDIPADFPIKLQEVTLIIPAMAHAIIQASYNPKSNEIDTRWLTSFDNVPVLDDEAKGLKYVEIPANYLDLPNNIGLYHISPQLDQKNKFKPVKASFLSMYNGLEAEDLMGYVGYWPEGSRIYFNNKFSGIGYKCETVLMKLLCTFDQYDDYDDIFMEEATKMKLISALIDHYGKQLGRTRDTTTDNRYAPSLTPQP